MDRMTAAAATVTRFAPSPTGRLHLGHAYSALFAQMAAQNSNGTGRFLLRIEDIDIGRCREEFVAGILEDLHWLGLEWEEPVRRQSRHFAEYRVALDRLDGMGVLYPCFCTRRDIAAEIERAGAAPQGPDGPLYPGTCRALSAAERKARVAAGEAHALRLDMARAIEAAGGPLSFTEETIGTVTADPARFGDVVLARKDVPTSYHLAVTLDDHLQGVTLVTRGEDLLPATHLHRLLQALLDLDTPRYRHHRLLTDETGRRFAKRDRAETLAALRERGVRAQKIRARLGFE
jgi:glutamyl-Q tRNA(Asp) synthetase